MADNTVMDIRRDFSFVTCGHCHTSFEKKNSEIKRSIKCGRGHFCKRSCAVSYGNKAVPRGTTAHLNHANRLDEYTPFRWFILRCNSRRGKKGAVDLTVEYLKKLWEDQNGICPYTGWQLSLPIKSDRFAGKTPQNASIDRIDCSKGYVMGNVQFVSVMANYAKNTFSDNDLKAFCFAVASKSSPSAPTLPPP